MELSSLARLWALVFLGPLVGVVLGFPALSDLRMWQYLGTMATLIYLLKGAITGPSILKSTDLRTIRSVLWASLILFITNITLRYYAVSINGVDFSIFDWMLVNTLRGRFMYSPIYDVNHFGVHPSWIMLVLVPLKQMISHPLALLIVGVLTLWAAVLPLWALCRARETPGYVTLMLLVGYLSCSVVGTLANTGFRTESLIPLALFYLFWAWDQRRWGHIVAATLLGLSIKEDMALYLGAWFMVYALWPNPQRRLAWILATVSFLFIWAHVGWIQPYFLGASRRTPEYLRFWQHYGGDLPAILQSMMIQPIQVVQDITSSGWWKLYGPMLLLPLFSARVVVASLPGIFILGTAASYPAMHQYGHYYPLPLLCFAILGFLDFLQRWGTKHWAPSVLVGALILFPLFHSGSVQVLRPDPEVYAGAKKVREHLEENYANATLCVQPALFPYLGYQLNLIPYFDSRCRQQGVIYILVEGRKPYPWTAEQWEQFIADHQGSALRLAPGFLIIKG